MTANIVFGMAAARAAARTSRTTTLFSVTHDTAHRQNNSSQQHQYDKNCGKIHMKINLLLLAVLMPWLPRGAVWQSHQSAGGTTGKGTALQSRLPQRCPHQS